MRNRPPVSLAAKQNKQSPKQNQKKAGRNRRRRGGRRRRARPGPAQRAEVLIEPRRVRRRGPRRRPAGPPRHARISKCALQLALALADPWHPGSNGVCVPFGATNTKKLMSYNRFSVPIGLRGFGYVLVTPTVSQNTPIAYYTDQNFNATDTRVLSAANTLYPGVNRLFPGQIPYLAASFIGGHGECTLCSRIVSVGIRCRYIGTNLNQSGLIYIMREATHGSVQFRNQQVGGPGNWGSMKECILESNDRRWHSALDYAHNDDEKTITGIGDIGANVTGMIYPFSKQQVGYYDPTTNVMYSDTVNAVPVGVPTLGMLFTGFPGEVMEVDIVEHLEYYGTAADQDSSPTPADPSGMEQVYAAANKTVFQRQAESHRSGWKLLSTELKKGAKELESVALSDVDSAVAALV